MALGLNGSKTFSSLGIGGSYPGAPQSSTGTSTGKLSTGWNPGGMVIGGIPSNWSAYDSGGAGMAPSGLPPPVSSPNLANYNASPTMNVTMPGRYTGLENMNNFRSPRHSNLRFTDSLDMEKRGEVGNMMWDMGAPQAVTDTGVRPGVAYSDPNINWGSPNDDNNANHRRA